MTGLLELTTTSNDPYISMYSIGSFDPNTYKYIQIRYKVTSGTAGNLQIYFTNALYSAADGAQVVEAATISDNTWRIVNVDMSTHANWLNSNITGWRFDYATQSGATILIDYIALGAGKVVGHGTTANVSPTTTTNYYVMRSGQANSTSCATNTVTVNSSYCTKTWDGGGSDNNWSTPENWSTDIAPSAGEDLIFQGSTRTSPYNDYTAGTSFKSISFSSGASNFTLSGNSIELSGGASAITTNTTSGTMTIQNNITFNTAAPTITNNTATTLVLSGTIANGGLRITVTGSGNTQFTNVISGSEGITINTALDNVTLLSANNTFGGNVQITMGGIRIQHSNGLGLGPKTIIMYNGTAGQPSLRLDGSGGDISIASNIGFNISVSTGTYGGVINEAGNNTIAGPITLNSGGGDSRFRVDGGSLTITGNVSPIVTNRGLILSGTGNGTFSGILIDNGFPAANIKKYGTGTWTISGANTYTGSTLVDAGTLRLGATGVIPDGSAVTVNGTLDLYGYSETVGSIAGSGFIDNTLGVGTYTLTSGFNNMSTSFSGIIKNSSGTIAFKKTGTGVQTISGGNTYSGSTTISAGTLKLGAAGVIPDASAVIINGTLDLNGFSETVGSITNTTAGIGTIDNVSAGGTPMLTIGGNNSSTTFSGVIMNTTGTISITKIGSARLLIRGQQAYSGSTTISTGTLALGGGDLPSEITQLPNGTNVFIASGAFLEVNGRAGFASNNETIGSLTGSGSIITTNGGTTAKLTINNSFDCEFSGQIIGNADNNQYLNIAKSNTGTLTLSGNNLWKGSMTVSAGTLKLGSTTALGAIDGGTSIASGAVLDLNGQNYTTAEPLTINGSGISNGGALKNSSSTAATFAGLITLGSSSFIVATAGHISLTHTGTITGATYDLTVDGSYNITIESIIGTSTGTITKNGTGILTLSGTNTYTGLTTVNNGILRLNNASALGSTAAGTTIGSGAALDLNGINYSNTEALNIIGTGYSSSGALYNSSATAASFAGDIYLSGATTITTNNQITLSGTISNNQHVTKNGTNSLIFANNTVTVNNLSISAGTLDGANSIVNIYGNFTSAGTFIPNSNGIVLLGSGQQTIPAVSFYNLTINNASGAIMGGNIVVNGTLTMMNGILNTDIYEIVLGANASIIEATPSTTAPSSYVLGKVKTTRPLMNGITNSFGGIGVEITENNFNNNSTVVTRVTGTSCIGIEGNESITRYFTIEPFTDAGLDATLVFSYFDHEIIGHSETNLMIYKSIDSRATWSPVLTSSDAATNMLSTTGISSFSDWTASDGINAPLPIELIDFNAFTEIDKTTIEWISATETNNDFFTLERSIDGINWVTIKKVDGAGSSNNLREYLVVDFENLEGIIYYRLKQTDFDGNYSYSKVITIEKQPKFSNQNVIFYNKSKKYIEFKFKDEIIKNIDFIEIISLQGQVMYRQNFYSPTIHNITLPKGAYYVYVQHGNTFTAQKLICN
jgi:autotransporter-associated beta strand protein